MEVAELPDLKAEGAKNLTGSFIDSGKVADTVRKYKAREAQIDQRRLTVLSSMTLQSNCMNKVSEIEERDAAWTHETLLTGIETVKNSVKFDGKTLSECSSHDNLGVGHLLQ